MRKVFLFAMVFGLIGCDDTVSAFDRDLRDHAKIRLVNAYRLTTGLVSLEAFTDEGVRIGDPLGYQAATACNLTTSTVPEGQHRIDIFIADEDEPLTSVTHNFDASKEYLLVVMPTPPATQGGEPGVRAVVIEEDFSSAGTVHADSFALRVVNAGTTAGTAYVTVSGTTVAGSFASGPPLVTGSPLAPRALQPDSFPAPFTIAVGEISDVRKFRSATIAAVPPLPAIPGQLRIRFFTDGILLAGSPATAVAPRSNLTIATGSFTATNGRGATVILTDRPVTGTVTGVVAPRCTKLA